MARAASRNNYEAIVLDAKIDRVADTTLFDHGFGKTDAA
jgi:hypothetical protein